MNLIIKQQRYKSKGFLLILRHHGSQLLRQQINNNNKIKQYVFQMFLFVCTNSEEECELPALLWTFSCSQLLKNKTNLVEKGNQLE